MRWLAGALLVASVSSVSPAAGAEPAPAPSVKEVSQAMFRLEEGKRALARGDADAAIAALEPAHAVLDAPTSAVPLAKAYAKKGRLAEALLLHEQAAASKRSPNESFAVAQARAEAQKLAAELEPRVPRVEVVIQGADDAVVEVDGKARTLAEGGVLRLDPGPRRIAAVAGERRAEKSIELAESARERVELDLRAPTASGTSATGAVPAAAQPPGAGDTLRPGGRHSHAESGASVSGLVSVSGFAVAVTGGALGLGTLLFSTSRRSDVEASCGASCSPAAEREIEQMKGLTTFSIIALAAGGAGLATGVVFAIAGSGSESEGSASAQGIELGVGPGYVGLGGRF